IQRPVRAGSALLRRRVLYARTDGHEPRRWQPVAQAPVYRHRRMRVLYLVPQPKAADRIGAYSFLDEEIQALAGAGIEAFVLSTAAPADADLRGAHLRSAPARRSVRSRLAATGFLLRHVARYPRPNLARPLKAHRTARIEHLAAEI